ncbi:hypothetical protein PRIO_2258 [Paenibacillus riograndensis SBR5]|uniref:Uncharacterized protein n=1 Tax=Paenibacillus riograndensis SBR5 TaxID=1073571 RepID=A0A0E4CVX4_9BACL|nr:hypothetical protein PRIO_2258 [Paenibacillus riograndensis SBR5]
MGYNWKIELTENVSPIIQWPYLEGLLIVKS